MDETIPELAKYIGASATILGGLGGLFAVYRWGSRFIDDIRLIKSRVAELHHMTGPNGGSSVMDSLSRVEDHLARNYGREKALHQDADHGIMYIDESGMVEWVNRTYCIWAGRQMVDFIGANWHLTIAEKDRHKLVIEWDQVVNAGRHNFVEYGLLHVDGSVLECRARTYIIQDEKNRVLGWVAKIHRLDGESTDHDRPIAKA